MFAKLINTLDRWLEDAPAAAPAGDTPTAARCPLPEDALLLTHAVLDEHCSVRGSECRLYPAERSAAALPELGRLLAAESLPGHQLWFALAEEGLTRLGLARSLPPRSALLISATNPRQSAAPDTRDALRLLAEAGHELWLDDVLGTPWFESLATRAHGAVVRLALRTPEEAERLFARAREQHPGLRLGAWEIACAEDFQRCRTQHCTRLAGSFITRRDPWQGREPGESPLSVASLINQVRGESSLRAIAAVLRRDMALAGRLLRYVNTAQGMSRPVETIEQALLILGQDQLDHWLTLLLLAGSSVGEAALTETALARGRLVELLGRPLLPAAWHERLFALGLYSLLDVALRVPLPTALAPLRLDAEMTEALLEHRGPCGALLALAEALERGHGAEVQRQAEALELDNARINAAQIEALAWVAELSARPALRNLR